MDLGATSLARVAGGVKVGPVYIQLMWPCADGYVSMMSTPQQLPKMLAVLDDDALINWMWPRRGKAPGIPDPKTPEEVKQLEKSVD